MLHNQPPDIAFFEKPAKVKESTIQKKWIIGSKYRKKYMLDNQLIFYIRPDFIHDKHQEGSDGAIIPAYTGRNGDDRRYVVKVFNYHKNAQHEAKYHRMLGRNAYWFTWEGSTCLLADWQQGLPLWMHAPTMTSLSYADRLKCVIAVLNELNILHSKGRVHFDIAARNLILDLKNLKISLIDFSSCHKSPTSLTVDIERLATVLKEIVFPEIFNPKYHARKDKLSEIENGIMTMIQQMSSKYTHSHYEPPCSAQTALDACTGLLKSRM